jgi:hypothetical protein
MGGAAVGGDPSYTYGIYTDKYRGELLSRTEG